MGRDEANRKRRGRGGPQAATRRSIQLDSATSRDGQGTAVHVVSPCPNAALGSCLQKRQVLESLSEDRLGGKSEPLIEERGVDPAEVDRPFQIAVDQLAESGRLADKTGLDLRPRDEHGTGGPVVGTKRTIFSGPPTELAEREQHDAIGLVRGRQVIQEGAEKGGDRAVSLSQRRPARRSRHGCGGPSWRRARIECLLPVPPGSPQVFVWHVTNSECTHHTKSIATTS
jgi:hypothetical protein